MKVLHVLSEIRPSGAEVTLQVAAPVWQQLGLELHVLSLGGNIGSYAEELQKAGYSLHHLPFRHSGTFLLKYHRFINRGSFDVVHIHTERAAFWLGMIARCCGRKRIIRTIHGLYPYRGWLRFRRSMQRRIMRWSGVVHVSVGETVREQERKSLGNITITITNWYDNVRFRPPSASERKKARLMWDLRDRELAITTVGNCSKIKNHTALLEALYLLKAEFPFIYLHAGEENGETEKIKAQTLGLADRVRFLGFVRDVPSLLHASDLFIMPSLWEAGSIATREAMATGLPVILTDVPGLWDLRHTSNGIVWVQPDPESIAQGIRTIAAMTEEQRFKLGREIQDDVSPACEVLNGSIAYANLYGSGNQVRPFHGIC